MPPPSIATALRKDLITAIAENTQGFSSLLPLSWPFLLWTCLFRRSFELFYLHFGCAAGCLFSPQGPGFWLGAAMIKATFPGHLPHDHHTPPHAHPAGPLNHPLHPSTYQETTSVRLTPVPEAPAVADNWSQDFITVIRIQILCPGDPAGRTQAGTPRLLLCSLFRPHLAASAASVSSGGKSSLLRLVVPTAQGHTGSTS